MFKKAAKYEFTLKMETVKFTTRKINNYKKK